MKVMHNSERRNLTKRALFFLFKKIGWASIRKKVWDEEFSDGVWNYLEPNPSQVADKLNYYMEKYCNGGNILELGCGFGKTGLEIDPDKYTHYKGVDISMVAITKAIEFSSADTNRHGKNSFVIGDISAYVPETKYNIILFRESIYYLNKFAIQKMLNKYKGYLKDDGVIIVRIHDSHKYKSIIRLIINTYNIQDKFESDTSRMIILVFR